MNLKKSQTNLFDHSEVKVRLLKLYLERYLNILSNSQYVQDVFIYDLFCGQGYYENEGKGSPIVILETIKNVYFSSLARNNNTSCFNCLFNDIEKEKVGILRDSVLNKKLHVPEMGSIEYSNNDYREMIPLLKDKLSKLRNEKAFIFLDPYGYKDIRILDISSLVASKKAEVLLFLPTQFMFRFETKGTPQSLKEFISELIPESEWPSSTTGIDFIEKLKDGFRQKLGKEHFVDSFIISRDKNQFFCLFFFTSHIYGFEKMLDAKWKIDEEEGRGWSFKEENNLFSTVEKSPNINNLENKLVLFLKEGYKTNAEIYEYTLRLGHLPKHTVNILTKFQNENKIITETLNGGNPRKGSFYLNYKCWKNEPNKIKIKLIST